MKKHIIFDLDGTLIDSAPSILNCFSLAFKSVGIVLQEPLTQAVIGPPLFQTLKRLSGIDNQTVLNQLAEAFKQHYDSAECLNAVVYQGIPSMLKSISKSGVDLYIATNKRIYPTNKIIQNLAWQSYFRGVFALDYFQPPLTKKAEMVGQIVKDYSLDPFECIYIGDRVEDGLAADANEMDFVLVTWGYAEASANIKPSWQVCNEVNALPALIAVS